MTACLSLSGWRKTYKKDAVVGGFSGGEEKAGNALAGWDLCWGASLAASHSKGGTQKDDDRAMKGNIAKTKEITSPMHW
ncbi:hypothetical protein EDM58_13135 [Brevibacillus panacihumi]|uniref:Uncharacterized protein n=1 Tax=Brevibacillus panacihumi TaxID=497735 RepID=A0A3M8CQA8_9BACL|nr:hypothetical protein EDM58_13135 [Brevibacillus panacihumi]